MQRMYEEIKAGSEGMSEEPTTNFNDLTVEQQRIIQRKAQKILNHKLKYRLPQWRQEGSREEWIKDLYTIRSWNWSSITWAIVKRDKQKCQECNLACHDTALEVHHIIPVMSGGSDHPHNLKSLCSVCHRRETNNLLKNKTAYHRNQRRLIK